MNIFIAILHTPKTDLGRSPCRPDPLVFSTLVFDIMDPKALGDFLVLEAIAQTDGCAVAVDDEDILMAEALLASREGTFVCPEGAATLSAAIKLVQDGWIQSNEKVVLLNTGSGLKYPETVQTTPPVLNPGDTLPQK